MQNINSRHLKVKKVFRRILQFSIQRWLAIQVFCVRCWCSCWENWWRWNHLNVSKHSLYCRPIPSVFSRTVKGKLFFKLFFNFFHQALLVFCKLLRFRRSNQSSSPITAFWRVCGSRYKLVRELQVSQITLFSLKNRLVGSLRSHCDQFPSFFQHQILNCKPKPFCVWHTIIIICLISLSQQLG